MRTSAASFSCFLLGVFTLCVIRCGDGGRGGAGVLSHRVPEELRSPGGVEPGGPTHTPAETAADRRVRGAGVPPHNPYLLLLVGILIISTFGSVF